MWANYLGKKRIVEIRVIEEIWSSNLKKSDTKVKELIEELKKLDQEKGIWVVYDGYCAFPPLPDEEVDYGADEDDAERFSELGMKKGDYLIVAG